MAKIRSLQILRFIAVLFVLELHATAFIAFASPGTFAHRLRFGGSGVDIFFLISGAIMYLIAFSERQFSAWQFFRRRFERVAPIYYLVTLVWLPFVGLLDRPVGQTDFATTILFWPAWGHLGIPILSVGWTLCFEMLFYTAISLAIASRRWVPALLTGFALCWLLRIETGFTVFRFLGNPVLLEFLLGMAIAAFRPKAPAWLGFILLFVGFTALLLWPPPSGLAGETITGESSFTRVLHWGMPSGLILAGAFVLEPTIIGKWTNILEYFGDASYATYLIHWPVMATWVWLLGHANEELPALLEALLFMFTALAFGAVVHHFVELPLLHYLRSGCRIAVP